MQCKVQVVGSNICRFEAGLKFQATETGNKLFEGGAGRVRKLG